MPDNEALPSECACAFTEPQRCFGQGRWHVFYRDESDGTGTAWELCPEYAARSGREVDPEPYYEGERKYAGCTRLKSGSNSRASGVVKRMD